MKILVILGHPSPDSFNHAIATETCSTLLELDHKVIFHDLQAEKFDPILPAEEIPKEANLNSPIDEYCEELASVDGIVVIHPNWWGQPPAILKGWIDRVFRPGVAYEFEESDGGEGVPLGLLKANSAVVFTTSNTAEERERKIFGDPLETLWKNCIFGLCGVHQTYRKNFGIVCISTLEQRVKWPQEAKKIIIDIFSKN